MAQVGRISGQVLTANLERNGIDLAFRDTLGTTPLLKLDVTNNRIAVNRAVAAEALDATSSDIKSTTILSDSAKFANLYFENNNEINVLSGDITIESQDIINLPTFQAGNVFFRDNRITSTSGNITLDANGTGIVEATGNVNVTGNVNATGNITLDGNLTFGDAGDDSTQIVDTVTIDGEIDSNILPSANNTYNLGSSDNRWNSMFAETVNPTTIIAETYNLANYNTETRTGNSIYVATNGDDTNEGDHPNSPFASVKRALDFADASISGPVTIFIYPGEYTEELPLTVPSQVTVRGKDFRNCIIVPDGSSQSEDVFLMNGESTVTDLTIKNFNYDSVNDKGYAFRFAPNTTVTTRSPYIQNVSVITQGSTTSADDPRGFAAGDAGKGALVDGASVTSGSAEASMLFHSVTFITPGVDALTMTNGVRVEWLNSFTYFANRGLYAKNGTTGHLDSDGSTIKYGAEVRSIGSASVYGNYGAVADGNDVIMYLIMHNFAYIGSGKFVDNDPSRVIQTQEVTELNNGRCYFQSTDHKGDFRVGQEFFASQETGETSLEISEADVDSINGLTVTQGVNVTMIDGTEIRFPNFRLKGNTVETTTGGVTIAPTNDLVINANTAIGNSLSVSGNISVDGAINDIGNAPTDTVDFDAEFINNLEPSNPGQSDLGSTTRRWQTANLGEANISDVRIQENYITTTVSNSDLELRANGTGIIDIPSNNVQIDNNLTANGTTDLQGLGITGSFSYIGTRLLKTEGEVVGIYRTETLTGDSVVDTDEFQFFTENPPPIPVANPTLVYTTEVSRIQLGHKNGIRWSYFGGPPFIGKLLKLEAPGVIVIFRITGGIAGGADSSTFYVETVYNSVDSFDFDGVLTTFTHADALKDANLDIAGNFSVTGTLDMSSTSTFNMAQTKIGGNALLATQQDANLELRASGTGEVRVPNETLRVEGKITGTNYTVGDIEITEAMTMPEFSTGDILVRDNFITTTQSNSNLELRANGVGRIRFEDVFSGQRRNYVDIDTSTITATQSLTNSQTTFNVGEYRWLRTLFSADTGIASGETRIIYTGGDQTALAQVGHYLKIDTGSRYVVLEITLSDYVEPGNYSRIQVLWVDGTEDPFEQTAGESVTFQYATAIVGSISYTNNVLRTESGNLVFNPEANAVFDSTKTITLPRGTTAQRSTTEASFRYNTTQNAFEGRHSGGYSPLSGVTSDNYLTSVTADTTGDVLRFTIGGVSNPLDSTDLAGEITSTEMTLVGLQVEDVLFDDNVVTTNTSNADLELRANGAGDLVVSDNITLQGNKIIFDNNLVVTSSGEGYSKINSSGAFIIPSGTDAQRPASEDQVGRTRYNTEQAILETWNGTEWIPSAGSSQSVTEEFMQDRADLFAIVLG